MRDSRKTIATGTIPSPQAFRAAATGSGQTLAASERTGAIRAQRVSDSCDPTCAKHLPNSYPRPYVAEVSASPGSSRPKSGMVVQERSYTKAVRTTSMT